MNSQSDHTSGKQLFTFFITVSGKVQGVYYRQRTREKASALGISGQVKNLPNGDVLIIATGAKEQLDELINWCRKGPALAQVKNIITENMPLQNFEVFSIIH